jgi:putative endonuclease
MRKIRVSNTHVKGVIGEQIAMKYLVKSGFLIVDKNFRKRWGEIDIIAKKDNIYHFFEVKSILDLAYTASDSHRPEDNVSGWKTHKIARMIETYLYEKLGKTGDIFHFHVICVYLNFEKRKAKVKLIKDIVL